MILVQQFKHNRFFILLGSALLLLGVLFLLLFTTKKPSGIPLDYADATLISEGVRVAVSIADTPEEREQGLSGTQELAPNTGKFFIFDTSGMYGFWMKDMNYSIDIVWIDSDMKIVSLSQHVTPESYPEVVYPEEEIMYVLEVPSGFSQQYGLKRGQSFTLKR